MDEKAQEFEGAYRQNGRRFARHSDLINILGWGRFEYTQFVISLTEGQDWVLESGDPSGQAGDFPVFKPLAGGCFPCYSIRRVE